MTTNRREQSYRIRVEAAETARRRIHPEHRSNPDEQRYASANYAMSFTKGLKHDSDTGLVANPNHFEAFRKAIDEGFVDSFTLNAPVPAVADQERRRSWEAPTAGIVYDLEGPDAQAVTMSPAPQLGSDELAYEMAEVYELALLRDVPLTGFSDVDSAEAVRDSVGRLNGLQYSTKGYPGRPRKTNLGGQVTPGLAFRGSSPAVEIGPYLSQFLLIGTVNQAGNNSVASGKITYGALTVDQCVPVAKRTDYMTVFDNWLKVQNGVDTQKDAALFEDRCRFITTPRDLATYVHYDALYEAYLNACLILLAMETPFDHAFDNLSGFPSGRPVFINHPPASSLTRQAGGFALYGAPHILTLVTEVATRALKAVLYQKFNTHLRLRPEALAARIEKASTIEKRFPNLGNSFSDLRNAIEKTVTQIKARNKAQGSGTALLPMAFQEGSPMHPSYGAGHAAVAGACVTVLKAYFDTSAVFAKPKDTGRNPNSPRFKRFEQDDIPAEFVSEQGIELRGSNDGPFLTLEGELNKLAANISIGRNMAGVHYFSDYYDSLRMGEEVAIGLLEEQALCYSTDPFILALPTFDGQLLRIGAR